MISLEPQSATDISLSAWMTPSYVRCIAYVNAKVPIDHNMNALKSETTSEYEATSGDGF